MLQSASSAGPPLSRDDVDHAARAIWDFERFTEGADFVRGRYEDAIAYP